jgi:hypothetical protein
VQGICQSRPIAHPQKSIAITYYYYRFFRPALRRALPALHFRLCGVARTAFGQCTYGGACKW